MGWAIPSSADRAYSLVHLPNFNGVYEFKAHFRLSSVTGYIPIFAVSNSDGYDYFAVNDGNAYIECQGGSTHGSIPISTGVWYCMFGGRSGGGNTLFVYIDAVPDATFGNVPSARDAPDRMDFGGFRGSGAYCIGDIAQPRLWEGINLTDEERLAEMASPSAVRTDGLWADWQTPQSAAYLDDFSGNDRHLTESGALGSVENPVGGLEDILITPASVSVIGASINPVVTLGSISLSPTAVTSSATAIDPDVSLGNVTVSPAPVISVASAVGPAVRMGDITLTPAAAGAVSIAVDPSVIINIGAITPAAVYGAVRSVSPVVILGSLAIMPGAATVKGLTIPPAVSSGTPDVPVERTYSVQAESRIYSVPAETRIYVILRDG